MSLADTLEKAGYVGATLRWEYLVETVTKGGVLGLPAPYSNEDMQKDLDKRGKDGWELVMMAGGTIGTKHMIQFIWKRRIVESVL